MRYAVESNDEKSARLTRFVGNRAHLVFYLCVLFALFASVLESSVQRGLWRVTHFTKTLCTL